MYKVWLFRRIGMTSNFKGSPGFHNYVKKLELSISPFIGMCISLMEGLDPVTVEEVQVNRHGAVILYMEDWIYELDECSLVRFPSSLKRHTKGWRRLPEGSGVSNLRPV